MELCSANKLCSKAEVLDTASKFPSRRVVAQLGNPRNEEGMRIIKAEVIV